MIRNNENTKGNQMEDDGQPSEYEEWQDYFGGLGVEKHGTYGADPNGE